MKHSAAGWLVWADTPSSSDLWAQQLSEPVPGEPPAVARVLKCPFLGHPDRRTQALSTISSHLA